jgi:hypothetical protein
MPEEIAVKKMFKNPPEVKKTCWKAKNRWLNVENDMKKMVVIGWRAIATDTPGN